MNEKHAQADSVKELIQKKLEENGERIHQDYFGVEKIAEDKYLVYWVAQGYIDEFDVSEDDDVVKILINVATLTDEQVQLPESVLDYIPTAYIHVKNGEKIREIDEFLEELKENSN